MFTFQQCSPYISEFMINAGYKDSRHSHLYVVVQFYPRFNFHFPLFYIHCQILTWKGTMENKNGTKDKIDLQHIFTITNVFQKKKK